MMFQPHDASESCIIISQAVIFLIYARLVTSPCCPRHNSLKFISSLNTSSLEFSLNVEIYPAQFPVEKELEFGWCIT